MRLRVSLNLSSLELVMNPHAVKKAAVRLQRARKAHAALEAAKNFEDAEEAWTDFLLAANGFYSVLEQGSKSHGPSSGWFGRLKGKRKKDPLLKYLHFARNSDEHGVRRVTNHGGIPMYPGGESVPFGEKHEVKIQPLDENKNPIGEAQTGFFMGPRLVAITAHDDRFSDSCDPPEEHLGQKFNFSDDPRYIAEAALSYLESALEEAAKLPSGPA